MVLLVTFSLWGQIFLKHDILYLEIPSMGKTLPHVTKNREWSANLSLPGMFEAWMEWTKRTPHIHVALVGLTRLNGGVRRKEFQDRWFFTHLNSL